MVSITPIRSARYTGSRQQGAGVGGESFGRLWGGELISSSPFELIDVEGEFEGRAELQAHVFHHHIAA